VTANDLRSPHGPEVTIKGRHFPGGHLEEAVEGLSAKLWARLSSYKAVTHRNWQLHYKK